MDPFTIYIIIDSNTVEYSLPRRVLINVVISDKHFVKYLEHYNRYAYIFIQKNSCVTVTQAGLLGNAN